MEKKKLPFDPAAALDPITKAIYQVGQPGAAVAGKVVNKAGQFLTDPKGFVSDLVGPDA